MSKLLKMTFCAIAIISAFTVDAEVVRSRSYYSEKPPTIWFVRGGVSLNTASGDFINNFKETCADYYSKGSSGMKVGFDVSVGFERFIGNQKFYYGAEVGIGTRGFSIKKDYDKEVWNNKKNESASLNAINVKLPVYVGYCHPLNDKLKLDGHIGPYVSYDFSQGVKDEIWYDSPNMKKFVEDCKLDVGAAVGVGLWFNKFLFDITYQKGFLKCAEWNGKCTPSHIIFRVGYSF